MSGLSQLALETIVGSIPAGVVVVDKDRKIVYANSRAKQLLGVDLSGRKLSEYSGARLQLLTLNGDLYSADEIPASKALKDGRENKAEMLIQRPDGSRIVVSTSATPIRNENGEVTASVSIFEDITQRKIAEEALKDSEERFRLVAEAAKVMVYEVYIDKNTVDVFSGEEVLGYRKGEIPHSNTWWFNQIHSEDVDRIEKENREGRTTAKDYLLEYRIKRKQGDYIVVHDTVKVLRDKQGNATCLVGGVRDITKRKEDENALLRSRDLLEQKAAEVEEYANRMEELAQERARQLQEAQRLAAIGATAGMVGHDIRNPLQAIASDVYLLKDCLAAIPPSEEKNDAKESLDGIEKNVIYINKIVADLQDYSRKLTPEYSNVDLRKVVGRTLLTLDIPSNINIYNSVDNIESRTDEQFLRRALTNLITNAIQAMPDGGYLTLASYIEEGMVTLTVGDTGVGVPEKVKPKLFTPMVTTKAKGQGLGLAVVKRLIEALGGTITFESTEGKGTTFTIKLPLIGK